MWIKLPQKLSFVCTWILLRGSLKTSSKNSEKNIHWQKRDFLLLDQVKQPFQFAIQRFVNFEIYSRLSKCCAVRGSSTGLSRVSLIKVEARKSFLFTESYFVLMFWLNRTTSMPKSVLCYDVDDDLTLVWNSLFTQSCFPNNIEFIEYRYESKNI